MIITSLNPVKSFVDIDLLGSMTKFVFMAWTEQLIYRYLSMSICHPSLPKKHINLPICIQDLLPTTYLLLVQQTLLYILPNYTFFYTIYE